MGVNGLIIDSGSSMAKVSELILESKGICFLCLVQTRRIIHHEGKQNNIWSLCNLSRFLRINLRLSVQEVLPEVGAHYCIERSDVKVHLCQKCNELAIKFGELYDILELTRLRLNECVEQINDELSRSEKDTGRVEEARSTLTGGEESSEGEDDAGVTATLRLMNKLRSEVLRKGALKMKKDLPRVQLNKVKVKRKTELAVKTEPETEASWNNYIDANDFAVTFTEPTIQVNEDDPLFTPNGQCLPTQSDLVEPEKEVSEEDLDAAVSTAVPKMEMTDGDDPDFDMQRSSSDSEHEEWETPVAKKTKPKLTQPTRRKRLSPLFTPDGQCRSDLIEPETEVSNDDDPHFEISASECKIRKNEGGVDSDFEVPEEEKSSSSESSEFEEPGSPIPKKRKRKLRKPSKAQQPQSSECRFCSNMIKVRGARFMELHELKFHCHEFFKPYRLPHISEENFARIVFHILFKSIQIKFAERKKGKCSSTFKCPYCPTELKNTEKQDMYWMRHHMIKKHYEALSNKLRRLQDDLALKKEKEIEKGVGETCVCGCYLYSTITVNYHRRQFKCSETAPSSTGTGRDAMDLRPQHEVLILPDDTHCPVLTAEVPPSPAPEPEPNTLLPKFPKRKKGERHLLKTCRFCRNQINARDTAMIWQHEVKFHCHNLFQSHRLPHISEELFCRSVHHTLFKNMKTTMVNGKITKYECPYCPKKFEWTKAIGAEVLRLHMVKDHSETLALRLRELQNDMVEVRKNVEAEEKKAGFFGRTCICGCYLTTITALKYHRHRYSCPTTTEVGKKTPQKGNRDRVQSPKKKGMDTGTIKGNKRCRFCANMVYARDGYVLRQHEVKFHCHEMLKSHRLPHISEDLFCKIVNHILFQNINVVIKGSKQEKVCVCPYCDKEAQLNSRRGMYILRPHMIAEHSKALSDRLRRLQNDPEEIQEKMEAEEKNKDFYGKTCACGSYLATTVLSIRHRLQCEFEEGEEQKQRNTVPEEVAAAKTKSIQEQDTLGFQCHKQEVKTEGSYDDFSDSSMSNPRTGEGENTKEEN